MKTMQKDFIVTWYIPSKLKKANVMIKRNKLLNKTIGERKFFVINISNKIIKLIVNINN